MLIFDAIIGITIIAFTISIFYSLWTFTLASLFITLKLGATALMLFFVSFFIDKCKKEMAKRKKENK